jgi:hypothetical protein
MTGSQTSRPVGKSDHDPQLEFNLRHAAMFNDEQ